MRNLVILLPLLSTFVVWGCSPKKPAANEEASTPSTLPTFTVVESQDTTDRKQIRTEATALFTNRAFSELEALAAKYRASKEAYADGNWKLLFVYSGLEPDHDAPLTAWKSRVAGADEWCRKNHDSITARVAKARLLIGYAWAVRGSGYSDSVKEKQWTQFADLLGKAAEVLRGAEQLRERCPLYWSAWQQVGLGLQMEKADYEKMFQQATKEFPDYWFYFNNRATYLLPRWYGEEGDWEKDLTRSADGLGGESGDMLYAQVVCYVHNYGGGIDVFEGKRISWDRVEKGLGGLLKRFPESLGVKNDRVFLAGLAGDKDKARAYFSEIQDQCDLAVWHDKEKITNFVKWMYGN